MKEEWENEIEESMHYEASQPSYNLQDHEQHELPNLPISSNSLRFTNPEHNQQFFNELYLRNLDHSKISLDFRYNLICFYSFLGMFTLVNITSCALLYNENSQSPAKFRFNVIANLIVLLVSAVLLVLVLNNYSFFRKNSKIFSSLGILIAFYLVVCDERVLSGALQESYDENGLHHSVVLLGVVVLLKRTLYDNYMGVLILSLSAALLFLCLSVSLSPLSVYSVLYEFTMLLLVFAFLTGDSYLITYRTKQLFFRKLQEEKHIVEMDVEHKLPSAGKNSSQIEILTEKCYEIERKIKQAHKIIIYSDIKAMLKDSLHDMRIIMRKIANASFVPEHKVPQSEDLDKEDVQFISEYCDFYPSVPIAVYKPHTLRVQTKNMGNFFPFSSYGVEQLQSVLSTVGKLWNFDIWFVYNATGHSIYVLAKYFMHQWSLLEHFVISEHISDNYFKELETTYKANPYHNACHAADVLHTFFYLLIHGNIMKGLLTLDILCCIVAALAHDSGHPGVTNRFLVNSRDNLALQYNDNSVLENMHSANAFSIMSRAECNIFKDLNTAEWNRARKLVIDMIISTDMSKHFEILGRFKTRANTLGDLTLDLEDDKSVVLSMGLKCADIGHTAKDKDLHEKWTNLISEEFFLQGDLEKSCGLPVSMYCDRETTNISKSQFGFIKNICLPLYEAWALYVKTENVTNCLDKLKSNMWMWQESQVARIATVHKTGNRHEHLMKPSTTKGSVRP